MGYFMYVCPECKKIFKVQGNDKKVKCSNCSNILKDTKVAIEDWESMDKAQREEVKKKSCATNIVPEPEVQEQSVFEKFSEPSKSAEPEEKKCPKCGFMNPARSKFCNECGYDMNAPKPSEEKPKETAKKPQASGGIDSFFSDLNDDTSNTTAASNSTGRKSLFDMDSTSTTTGTSSFMSAIPETKEPPIVTSNYSNNVSSERSGQSKLSIIAFILSLLGCTSIIGLILAIVDLAKSKDDDNKHVLSWVCVGIVSFWFIVGVALGVNKGSSKKEIADTKPITEVAGQSDENTSSDSNEQNDEESGPEAEASTDSSVSEVSIEEQVLVDEDGIKITATKYVVDSIWGDGINLLIENNSSSDIGVGCDAVIVNDYMIPDLFSTTVAAGKKDNEVMNLWSSSLRAAGIENVGQIEIYMHTFDSDSYSTIKKFPCFTIKTSAFDSMDSTVNDEGKELFNEGGIRIVGKYVDENSFWGAAILLYIENSSGKNVTVQCDDLSINGFMLTPYFSSTIYDGKKAIDDITLMSSEMEENGITSIDDIELKFRIFDTDSFTTIKETDVISFSAK